MIKFYTTDNYSDLNKEYKEFKELAATLQNVFLGKFIITMNGYASNDDKTALDMSIVNFRVIHIEESGEHYVGNFSAQVI